MKANASNPNVARIDVEPKDGPVEPGGTSEARGATECVREEYALMRTAVVGKDALRRLEDAAGGDSTPRRARNRRG